MIEKEKGASAVTQAVSEEIIYKIDVPANRYISFWIRTSLPFSGERGRGRASMYISRLSVRHLRDVGMICFVWKVFLGRC